MMTNEELEIRKFALEVSARTRDYETAEDTVDRAEKYRAFLTGSDSFGEDHKRRAEEVAPPTDDAGQCLQCQRQTQWGWCPNCTPIHYNELP